MAETTQNGCLSLLSGLKSLGINTFFGVNGGAIIHLLQYIPDIKFVQRKGNPLRFITMSEYIAGFAPVGHYLATGKIAASIVTTGSAQKLVSCGLSDAKYMNIPALYIMGLNHYKHLTKTPLQDVGPLGMNILNQLKQEVHDGLLVIKPGVSVNDCLEQLNDRLQKSLPAVLAFYPHYLNQLTEQCKHFSPIHFAPRKANIKDIKKFVNFLATQNQRRIIIYVAYEATRYAGMKGLISKFSKLLKAPTIWTVNGANCIERNQPYGYGHIILGGNNSALEIWNSLNKNDILICLGVDAGEYTLNLDPIRCGDSWILSGLEEAYGQEKNTFAKRFDGEYHQIQGDIAFTLEKSITLLSRKKLSLNEEAKIKPSIKGIGSVIKKKKKYVDIIEFYQCIDELWQKPSLVFEDVCIGYTIRQAVLPKTNPKVNYYTAHQGSSMGGAFGLGVGAKYAKPDKHCFIFSGDGCWRLYGGNLIDFSHLKLILFIFNNANYAIVYKGLNIIIPGSQENEQHCQLNKLDFIKAAKANQWDAVKLEPNLSNLKEIMTKCYNHLEHSILIDIPTDPGQQIGSNPRYEHLSLSGAN